MTSLRRFTAHDLLQFNNVNLDYFTETVRARVIWQRATRQESKNRGREHGAWCGRPPALALLCPPPRHPTRLLQYNLAFYLDYLARWPEYCQMAEGPGGQAMGYSERGLGGLQEGVGQGANGDGSRAAAARECALQVLPGVGVWDRQAMRCSE